MSGLKGVVHFPPEPDPTKRAEVTGTITIEDRTFAPHNRYLPIPQGNIDNNPELEQNAAY